MKLSEEIQAKINKLVDDPADSLHLAQADEWVRDATQLESENEALKDMLKHCRKAIASLDIEALGTVPDSPDYGYGWPIREEILSRIDALLKETD